MYNYAVRHGKKFFSTYGISKPVRGAVSEAELVRRMRYDFEESVTLRNLKKKKDGHGPYIHHPNYLDDCGAYGNSATVTWNGHMVFCSFTSEPYVDLLKKPFGDAWATLMAAVSQIQKPDQCVNCKYEDETGSFDFVTEDYCKDAKHLYNIYNMENTE